MLMGHPARTLDVDRHRCIDPAHSTASTITLPLSILLLLPSSQRPRSRGVNPMAAMLALQLLQQVQRLPYKPPVTLALIVLQVAVHYMDTSPLFRSLKEVRSPSWGKPNYGRGLTHGF